LLFAGTFEHTIDDKHRLAIPSGIRQGLIRHGEFEAIYSVIQGSTLCLYTEQGFQKRADELDQSEMDEEELLAFEQVFFSSAERIEPDKQGRIRLPERQKVDAGLSKEVVVLGVKDHMQIHDRDAWNQKLAQMRADKPQMLRNPRLAMRNRRLKGKPTSPLKDERTEDWHPSRISDRKLLELRARLDRLRRTGDTFALVRFSTQVETRIGELDHTGIRTLQ
jgi:MraZ protein